MSIGATATKVQFDVSAGPPSSFPFTFKFWSTSEVKAKLLTTGGEIALALGTDYSVSAPGTGGTLTRLSTWPSATRLTVYRELELSQGTDLVDGSVQSAEVYETMVDRAVALAQQIDEKTDRIVRFPISEASVTPDMPSAADRASKYLAFDSSGNPIPATGSAGSYPVTAYMATLLDDNDELEAQKTLGLLPSASTVAITTGMKDVLATDPPAAVATMIETGDIAGMEADAEDVDYSGTTVDLNATTLQGAVEAVGGALKDLITGAGLTYDKTAIPTLFKRACRAYGQRVGAIVEFDDKFTPDADNPYLSTQADADILAANWPSLVTYLRGIKLEAGGSTSWSYTASGGVMTLSGTGLASLLADLAEENLVHGSFTNWLSVTVSGTEYTITAVTPGSSQITVGTSPPASGTVEIYVHRVANDATKARVFKDQGRATYSHDGATYLSGLRRRFRMQGHVHNMDLKYGAPSGSTGRGGGTAGTYDSDVPKTDGVNGTPITGPSTDAANSAKFRYYFGGIYLP